MGTGLWAITDQALFAGANFALNILLARWLGDAGYGVFGVAYAIFLFVSLAYTALVIDPLLIFGAGRWRETFDGYLWHVVRLLVLLSAIAAAVLILLSRLTYLIDESDALQQVVLTLAWAGPCIVLQWTLRRACYVLGRPRIAAAGGAIYFVALLISATVAHRRWELDARDALVIMALASLVASAYLWRRVSQAGRSSDPTDLARPTVRRVLGAHWTYGRWIFAGNLLGWLGTDLLYLVLARSHGAGAVGSLRASLNLVMPATHALVAISSVAVPWFVARIGSTTLRRDVVAYWAVASGLAALYSALLIILIEPLVGLVYGEAFASIGPIVAVIALIPIAAATYSSLGTILRALDRTRELFLASAVTAALTVTAGLWMTVRLGASGAAMALLLGAVVNATVVGLMTRRKLEPGGPMVASGAS